MEAFLSPSPFIFLSFLNQSNSGIFQDNEMEGFIEDDEPEKRKHKRWENELEEDDLEQFATMKDWQAIFGQPLDLPEHVETTPASQLVSEQGDLNEKSRNWRENNNNKNNVAPPCLPRLRNPPFWPKVT